MTTAQEKDVILQAIQALSDNAENGVTDLAQVHKLLEGFELHRIQTLANVLKEDDNIVKHGESCKIKDKGRLFLERGGYTHEENMHILRTQKAETKEDLELQQYRSVIATNVATQDAYKEQQVFNRNSQILAGVSVLFIVMSTVLQLCNKTDEKLEGIKQQLEKSASSLDSIKLQLKEQNMVEVHDVVQPDTTAIR